MFNGNTRDEVALFNLVSTWFLRFQELLLKGLLTNLIFIEEYNALIEGLRKRSEVRISPEEVLAIDRIPGMFERKYVREEWIQRFVGHNPFHSDGSGRDSLLAIQFELLVALSADDSIAYSAFTDFCVWINPRARKWIYQDRLMKLVELPKFELRKQDEGVKLIPVSDYVFAQAIHILLNPSKILPPARLTTPGGFFLAYIGE